MDNNTNNNQANEKKTSNRFKQAAERQKVAPGGAGAQPSQEQANMPLSFTSQPTPPIPETIDPEPKEEAIDIAAILQSRYADGKYFRTSEEGKTKTFNGLIKPSLNDRITKDINKKKIKSRNDLINFLLEEYYGLHDEQSK